MLLRNRPAVLALLLVLATWTACTRQDDEEKIRALIDDGAQLAEAHDISGILDLATENLLAMPMGLDRRGVKAVLWRTFRHYGALKVLYPRPSVDIQDDAGMALARLPFVILRKEKTVPGLDELRDSPVAWLEKIGGNADLYRLELQLIRQDDDWRVDRVTVERFTGSGFAP